MKAVIINKPGSVENFEFCDVSKPQIKEGWSLIKIQGFGINHSEIFTRQGKSSSVKFPRILGIECVGIIDSTTDNERLPNGQKVVSIMGEMGRDFDGSYAEYTLIPNGQIYPIESNLSWDILATIPESYYTAYGSFLSLQLQEEEEILVRGATSSVGIAFMKIVKGLHPKAKITGATRNINKRQKLLSEGFDDIIIDSNSKLETTTHSFSKIIDLIGPKSIKNSIAYLKPYGIICSVGQLGNEWYLNEFDPIFELRDFKKLTSFSSGDVHINLLNKIINMVEKGEISDVKPEKIFKLNEIKKAHEYIENEQDSFGKVIVINE